VPAPTCCRVTPRWSRRGPSTTPTARPTGHP
jgi:hypothetical protein